VPAVSQELRRRLTRLAARQSGYFTAAQARDLGYSYQAQRYHADRGNWVRIERGIYRLPEWPVEEHEDLVRWFLWSRQRAVVSHDTALSVHHLGDVNPGPIHLTVPPDFRQEAEGVVLHWAELAQDDVVQHTGFVVTAPLRTLLDVAGSDLPTPQFLAAITDALDQGAVTRSELLAKADEFGARAALRIERALHSEEVG
jgi:predicted transcriptional regulator of viral defense system